MPGFYERDRLLALELTSGALAGARGTIRAARTKSESLTLTAANGDKRRTPIKRAA
jgi:hypothetical protein